MITVQNDWEQVGLSDCMEYSFSAMQKQPVVATEKCPLKKNIYIKKTSLSLDEREKNLPVEFVLERFIEISWDVLPFKDKMKSWNEL